MLAVVKIREVERLLAEGKLSQRKIATAIGVSRATVSAVALGQRPNYEAIELARASAKQPRGPLARCAGCGGMVYMPCRLCRVRTMKQQEQEALRMHRRRKREEAARRLLLAVWRASQQREAAIAANRYLPPGCGASDCK